MYDDKGTRKFTIALVTMGLTTGGFIFCKYAPNLQNIYSEFCMWLLGAATVYSGTNVLEKIRRPTNPPPPA